MMQHIFNYKKTIIQAFIEAENINQRQSKIQNQQQKQKAPYLKDYRKVKWQCIFPYAVQKSITKIHISQIRQANINQRIDSARHYKNFKQLFIFQNSLIDNIQPLNLINCPYLKHLNINSNEICQIKCLNKLVLPFFESVYISGNPILETNQIYKLKLNSKLLTCVSLQNYLSSSVINQDLSFIVKLEAQYIKTLRTLNSSRIKQNKLIKMLNCRFPNIVIYCSDQQKNEQQVFQNNYLPFPIQ